MKQLSLILWFSLYCIALMAQPQPCDPDNPEMTSTCNEACIICDINGFTGRHEGTEDGEAPPGFEGQCTQQVHNMQWIAFIAGSVNLQVSLAVSNCDAGLGLEFGLYKGIDCQNFERISNCFGGFNSIPPGRSGVIENTEPLVIGQYYYIVMDGAREDNCDWTFSVLEGSTALNDFDEFAVIAGDFRACVNTDLTYTTDSIVGATLFEWELDGAPVGSINESSVELNFDMPGSYNLCMTPKNPCFTGAQVCEQIVIPQIAQTFVNESICDEDCLEIGTEVFCDAGTYEVVLSDVEGCDSIVSLNLEKIITPSTDLVVSICDDEVLTIGDTSYDAAGSFSETLTSVAGCDSLINLDLTLIPCNIDGESTITDVFCNGESTGAVTFSVVNGTGPFTYEWNQLGGAGLTGDGTLADLDFDATFTDLASGTYVVTIADGFGNMEVLITEVGEPEPMVISIESLDRNGFDLSCFDSEDAMLTAAVEGGTSPYMFVWDEGINSTELNNVGAGIYELTVTDSRACTSSISYEVNSPDAINLEVEFIDPNCDGFETGEVNVVNVTGGAGGFIYAINNSSFVPISAFDGLSADDYTITVSDQNGCTATASGTLIAPEIPIIMLNDDTTINLGDSLLISAKLNSLTGPEIAWSNADMLSCPDCLEYYLRPFDSEQVSLTVTSVDGCIATEDVLVSVTKTRAFYAPNIMDLGERSDNRYFNLFRSQEVQNYTLRIYDRWGNLVYEGTELTGDRADEGWDGRYNNTTVKPGVFVWSAEVLFLDGERINYSGPITVIN